MIDDKMMRNTLTLFKAFMKGIIIEIDGESYKMRDDYRILTKVFSFNTETSEEKDKWLGLPDSILSYMNLAETMIDKEWVKICSDIVVNEI